MRQTPKPFIPTVSVERPVIWENEKDQKEYWQAFHRALGKGLSDKQRSRHMIRRPHDLRVVQMRETVLAEQMENLQRYDQRQEAAARLACLLQERLNSLLKDSPELLSLELGNLACFTEPGSSQPEVMAMPPRGWRGPKAKYAASDDHGNVAPLHQLSVETQLYRDALNDTNSWFEPKDIVADPYITVIENRMGIVRRDFQVIGSSLAREQAIPDSVQLGDPVITLRMGPSRLQVEELSVRSFV